MKAHSAAPESDSSLFPAALKPPKKRRGRVRVPEARGDRSATLAFWMMVSPALFGLTLFTFIPIIWGFVLSLSHAQNTIRPVRFIGLANYIDLLTDEAFLRSLGTILIFALFIVPLTFAVSLGMALLVNRAGYGRAFFRTVFFIPSAVSYVVASLIWKVSLFNSVKSGAANQALALFGHEPIGWIGTVSPPYFWVVLVSVRLWLQVGFYMIIFLAALQEIPPSLYEAAAIDGAKPGWTTLRYITLPQLRATTISVLILNFIAAFQAFDEFYNILGATGANVTLARTPLIYLYSLALSDQDFGRGTAGAFILTFIIMAVTLIQGKIIGFGDRD
jgi:multiple sugar transport system permease protein